MKHICAPPLVEAHFECNDVIRMGDRIIYYIYPQFSVPLEITFIYGLVANGTFPPLLVSLIGTQKKKHCIPDIVRFTSTHLPVRDSAAHMTNSIHDHNEISWLKKKRFSIRYYMRCVQMTDK